MTLLAAERLGVQVPRVFVPAEGRVRSFGADAAELLALAGVELDPWQVLILEEGLAVRADGRWAAKTVDILVARQNGKNVTVEARELYGALILGEQVIHTAHLFPTAKKSFQRIKKLIQANPDIREKLVRKLESPSSGYSFEFRSGGLIEFVARSTTSGRGFTGDLLILDEAQEINEEMIGALLPSLSATSVEGDPQVWYLGTAPDAGAAVWQRRRRLGRDGGSKSSAYLEFSAEPSSDLDDRDVWAQANPGLNIRISEEQIEETERASMSDEMFAQERLSISPDTSGVSGRVIPLDAWDACRDARSGPVGDVMFGLDVSFDREWAAFAVAGESGRGGTHVEVVDYRAGTAWLVRRAKDLQDEWGGVLAIATGSPAASLLVELEAAGVLVLQVSPAQHAQACGALYDAVIEGTVRHIGQPGLTIAVAAAEKKTHGDAWLWDRRTTTDISPLVAVTLARWAHESKPPVMALPEVILL